MNKKTSNGTLIAIEAELTRLISYLKFFLNYVKFVGMSNHVRLDIRRFGSRIRIHPNVRIVCNSQCLHGIFQTIL